MSYICFEAQTTPVRGSPLAYRGGANLPLDHPSPIGTNLAKSCNVATSVAPDVPNNQGNFYPRSCTPFLEIRTSRNL